MKRYRLAVIGLGAIGGATLLAAARAGEPVIGIDRYDPPHNLGSTHGETRIVRAAIGEGIEYTPFAKRSFELWDQLSAETQTRLVERCGCLVLGGVLPHAMHVQAGFLETTIAAAQASDVPHEILTADQVRARFPAFTNFDGEKAFFEPGAGMAFPEAIVAAQIRRARELGAQVLTNQPVVALANDGDGVAIKAGTGTILADRAILAAGPWVKSFLPPFQAGLLKVTRQTLHWFSTPQTDGAYRPSHMPVFIWNDLYGFPQSGREPEIKIATETLDAIADPNEPPSVSDDDRAKIRSRVKRHFPVLGTLTRSLSCIYTSTPDFNFWIAQHPDASRITVVSACSGHGFKHAAAIGEAVVSELLGLRGLSIPTAWRAISQPAT